MGALAVPHAADGSLLPLLRLLQLSSPALPVGAYTYSQGLEWAVDSGAVRTEAEVAAWIGGLLEWSLARFEAPLLACQIAAWRAGDDAEAVRLNDDFLASRESAELRAETVQMGWSLARLLAGLDAFAALPGWRARLLAVDTPAFPTAWSAAAAAWRVPAGQALAAYLWAWAENQVMAAVKCVPLGQSAGQRLLAVLGERIAPLADGALSLPEARWSNYTPGLAIASSRHETQYTRLFRS
ncbi:urease accessory protein UreF [Thauera linaloolentis]|uniref:Urease accessory protein UreF n=1 Tax=Thauera linaloolentis (strain DSM 12138 / JCM 21573 / CCUG 41526 / CIP 105981 / IAM 15112 / NBRC 102519 / 47Lol) TaxID=1123367 RepID=N6YW82_THAL4|nr:urease accessory UreF family protein [Thauera linaloolentis]ENO84219.1 urease accessory protein UreF [Thauera linaloolentis 47Lol = DSM 12138]MCM8566773.1 urease accessory protein UreF [Thauera linaloolentis]